MAIPGRRSPEAEAWYAGVFSGLLLFGILLTIYKHCPKVFLDIWTETSRLVLGAAAVSFVSVEGVRLVIAQFRIDQIEARGEARGKEKGRQERDQDWEGWLERKNQAERENREFSEPSPAEMARRNGTG